MHTSMCEKGSKARKGKGGVRVEQVSDRQQMSTERESTSEMRSKVLALMDLTFQWMILIGAGAIFRGYFRNER